MRKQKCGCYSNYGIWLNVCYEHRNVRKQGEKR